MRFEDIMSDAQKALDSNDTSKAQVLALMAVAERLDRLCAKISSGSDDRGRGRW